MLSFCEVNDSAMEDANTYFCPVSFDRFVLTAYLIANHENFSIPRESAAFLAGLVCADSDCQRSGDFGR